MVRYWKNEMKTTCIQMATTWMCYEDQEIVLFFPKQWFCSTLLKKPEYIKSSWLFSCNPPDWRTVKCMSDSKWSANKHMWAKHASIQPWTGRVVTFAKCWMGIPDGKLSEYALQQEVHVTTTVDANKKGYGTYYANPVKSKTHYAIEQSFVYQDMPIHEDVLEVLSW